MQPYSNMKSILVRLNSIVDEWAEEGVQPRADSMAALWAWIAAQDQSKPRARIYGSDDGRFAVDWIDDKPGYTLF